MKLLTLLAIILLLSRCNIHTDSEIDYTLIIKNETSKNVQIITYKYGSFAYREHFKTVNIPSNTDYHESFMFFSSKWGADMSQNALLYSTDSIIVV